MAWIGSKAAVFTNLFVPVVALLFLACGLEREDAIHGAPDSSSPDAPHADATDRDAPHADATDGDAPHADATDRDAPHVDATDGDATHEDASGMDAASADATSSDAASTEEGPSSGGCQDGATQCLFNGVQTCVAGSWGNVVRCPSSTPDCVAGVCAQPPSCQVSTLGTTNCGAGGSGTESCCASPEVPGGTYYRTYDPPAEDGGLTR
jgi:hypothetical protein